MNIGGVKIVDNSDEIIRLMRGATKRAARTIGGEIVKYAKGGVDRARGPMGNAWPQEATIALKNSLTAEVTEKNGDPVLRVGSNMEIAPYIELGTGREYDPPESWLEYHGSDGHTKAGLDSWIYFDPVDNAFKVGKPVPPTPYLSPAVLDHLEQYRKIIQKDLENA